MEVDTSASDAVLPARSYMHAINIACKHVVGGEQRAGLTAAECAALNHLDPQQPSQRVWLEYLVWRKFMASAAIAVSVAIICFTAWGWVENTRAIQDVLKRCRAAAEPPRFDGKTPYQTLADLAAPLTEDFAVHAGDGQPVPDSLIATCAWAPLAPWRVGPQQNASVGCSAGSKTQWRQRRSCLCALSVNAYSSYDFIDFEGVGGNGSWASSIVAVLLNKLNAGRERFAFAS